MNMFWLDWLASWQLRLGH